jgi:hypothetical protein
MPKKVLLAVVTITLMVGLWIFQVRQLNEEETI